MLVYLFGIFNLSKYKSRHSQFEESLKKLVRKLEFISHYRWAEGSGLVGSQVNIPGDHIKSLDETSRYKEL